MYFAGVDQGTDEARGCGVGHFRPRIRLARGQSNKSYKVRRFSKKNWSKLGSGQNSKLVKVRQWSDRHLIISSLSNLDHYLTLTTFNFDKLKRRNVSVYAVSSRSSVLKYTKGPQADL